MEWNERALEDLDHFSKYIARDSKNYAILFVKKIYDSIQKLADFPKIGRVIPEVNISNIRELIFQRYRIIYRVLEDCVEILTIIHGSTLLRL
ncbi:MAG: type II toxin-antitoxin system RelE/ParE family toxin [Promethearchaeota archaeon]